MSRAPERSSYLFVIAALGCGSAAAPDSPDAGSSGPDAGAGGTDARVAQYCDGATPVAEGTSSVTVDTGSAGADLDLGDSCPRADGAPVALIDYLVPGQGLHKVSFSTAAGTAADFDTIVQARRGCDEIPVPFPPSCFDDRDAAAGDYGSAGFVVAEAGDILHFAVSGSRLAASREMVSLGVVELSVTAEPTSAPALTSASLAMFAADHDVVISNQSVVEAAGQSERDISGLAVTLLDDQGRVVDANGDGTASRAEDTLYTRPDQIDLQQSGDSFTAVLDTGANQGLPNAILRGRATHADISAFTTDYALSQPVRVSIDVSGYFDTDCAPGSLCIDELSCGAGDSCQVLPAVAGACDAAITVSVATPSGQTTSETVSGSVPAGPGDFWSYCTHQDFDVALATQGGAERIYRVTVPAGSYDLIARTDVEGTSESANTVVYVRDVCEDRLSELACHDRDSLIDKRAHVTVLDAAAGDHYIFVEQFALLEPGSPLPFGLQVSLRPVLASGASCDPDAVQDRCSAGPCPASGTCP